VATRVHPTALVHPDARLGDGVEIGPWSIVEACEIGDGSVVSPSVTIKAGAQIGRGVRIGQGSMLGVSSSDLPSDAFRSVLPTASNDGSDGRVRIADGAVLCSFTTICAGASTQDDSADRLERATVLGAGCYVMSYVVVGPGCRIGDHVCVTNLTRLGPNVTVGNAAGISGLVVVAPGIRIGELAFVGGCSQVFADVPPFTIAQGNPARLYGLNRVGIRRAGLPADDVRDIKRTCRLLFRDGLDLRMAVARVRAEFAPELTGPVRKLLDFVNAST
jgi:UDP-N-acetylglucosamine acyltransferase